MRDTAKKLFIVSAYAVLLTACGGGSNGNNDPIKNKPDDQPRINITAIEVDLNNTLPEYIKTFGSNLYIDRQNSSQEHQSLFMLKGLNASIAQPFYTISNNPTPFLPRQYITDYKSKNITFSYSPSLIEGTNNVGKKHSDSDEAWLAYDLKPDNLGNINAKWLVAKFEGTQTYDFTTRFYTLNKYAVAAFIERKSDRKLNSDLVFAEFAPIGSPSKPGWKTEKFMSNCAAKPEDLISTISSTVDVAGIKNNDYVIVGSRSGAVCIYGLPSAKYPGWHNLAELAIKNGAYKRNFITSVRFNSTDSSNLYGYWTNIDVETGDINILRAKINTNTWAIEFTNITDGKKLKNVPATYFLDHRSLFVDPQNNVYIGSSNLDDKQPTPVRVYVLPHGSDTWQKINLAKNNDDYGLVVSISLAADGITPIVGTKNFPDHVRLTDRAYYLHIQKEK